MRLHFFIASAGLAALVGCSEPPIEGRYVGVDAEGDRWSLTLESGGKGTQEVKGVPDLVVWFVVGDTVYTDAEVNVGGSQWGTRSVFLRTHEGVIAMSRYSTLRNSNWVYADSDINTPGRAGILLHRQPD